MKKIPLTPEQIKVLAEINTVVIDMCNSYTCSRCPLNYEDYAAMDFPFSVCLGICLDRLLEQTPTASS